MPAGIWGYVPPVVASRGEAMKVIQRSDIESVTSVRVGDAEHDLGLLKDFHRHPSLKEFMPDLARLSMSWVRLEPDEELAVHVHPTKSMIAIANGEGRVTGDLSEELQAGDVVIVPAGARHGFVGAGTAGFWALSVQFEGAGLYEDLDDPRVSFLSNSDNGDAEGPVVALRAENERFMRAYEQSALLRFVAEQAVEDDAAGRERLLDHVQLFSDAFQRVIGIRAAVESDPQMRRLAEEHLADELGHHELLQAARANGRPTAWDPVLAAVSSWWVDRMTTASSVERTVLAHLVLEGSGLVFHRAAYPVLGDGEYFAVHADGDEEHLEMGYRALAERHDWTLEGVRPALEEGWAMITLLSDRLVECARRR
jgi:quercetin dioxygenase-like cupin family protein